VRGCVERGVKKGVYYLSSRFFFKDRTAVLMPLRGIGTKYIYTPTV